MLPNEEEQFDDIRRLLQKSYSAPALSDQFTQRLGERLQTLLPAASRTLETKRTRNRISHWIGELSMRQRIAAVGGVGIVAVLAMLLVWLGSFAQPLSAMEKMAENIRKAKSYKYTSIVQYTFFSETGKPRVMPEDRDTVYWIAPGSARTEYTQHPEIWKGPGPEITEIRPAGKPGITINHQTKTYQRSPVPLKNAYSSVFDDLENLGKFSGKADRELDSKEINGKKARGFQIDMQKMDPRSKPGLAEIWLDPSSNLPVLACFSDMKGMDYTSTQKDTDIQWNIDLDPKLFDATPPEGYTDDTPKPPALEEQVRKIAEALKIYAEASNGHYLKTFISSERATEDVCKMLGLKKWPDGEEEGDAGKALKAFKGFDQIGLIQWYKPDFAYYGKTVGPKDKDKVLLHWKLDDGRYEVIFGDLRAETVTA